VRHVLAHQLVVAEAAESQSVLFPAALALAVPYLVVLFHAALSLRSSSPWAQVEAVVEGARAPEYERMEDPAALVADDSGAVRESEGGARLQTGDSSRWLYAVPRHGVDPQHVADPHDVDRPCVSDLRHGEPQKSYGGSFHEEG